jgi:CBS domain-containing protein
VDVKHEARTVGDAMTAPAVATTSFMTVASAAARMIEHGVNRLPVVDRDQLIGIVSRADLVRAFARSDDEIATEARELVALQQQMAGDPHVLTIDVADGDVVLTGTVRRRSDAELLPSIVRQVPGVIEVRADIGWSETD